jgi:hypothetical protein
VSYASLRDAIVSALETVGDIGRVYSYRRLVVKSEAARQAFDYHGRLAFADVDWSSARFGVESWDEPLAGPVTFSVRLYHALNDAEASGITFAHKVEAAALALSTCMAHVNPRQHLIAVDVVEIDHRMFGMPGVGDVLCHYAELRISPYTRLESA